MHAELRFINGPLGGQSVELPQAKNVLLGRASSCEIMVKAAGISRSHCRFDHDGRDYHLADLGSVNGTFVNNGRTAKHVLQDGDAIRIGQVEALFLWDETPASPSELSGEVPESLSEVILRTLAKSPEERYQTSRELLQALLKVREQIIGQA